MTATPPPVAPSPPQPAAGPRKTSGLAVGALILGICGIVPCLGVLLGGIGIVLGIVALARNAGGKGFAVGGIIAGLAGIVMGQALAVVLLLVPAITHAGEKAKRAKCAMNLKMIANGMFEYGKENQGAISAWKSPPPDLDVLVRQGLVSREMLQCPCVKRHRQCDYFYLAPSGDAADVRPDLLVACDFRGNHGGDGRNVLYENGVVRTLTEVDFRAELAKPVNAAFAAALKEAESKQQRGN